MNPLRIASSTVTATLLLGLFFSNVRAATIAWDAGDGVASTAWYTSTNWNPDTASGGWSSVDTAQFDNAGTAILAGISMNTASLSIGAIEVSSSRTRALTIQNSSATAGTLTLSGATVNSVSNTVLRNASNSLLTLNNGSGAMGVVLPTAGNNKIVIDAIGAGIRIDNVISGAGGIEMIRTAGASRLDLGGNNTYAGNTVLTSGRMRVLAIAGGNGIPNGALKGNLVFNGDPTTQFGLNASETINGLSGALGSGFIDNDSANLTNTLTLGDNNATASFGGNIVNSSSGLLGIIRLSKIGSGVQVFSGANSYSGTTTVGNGSLLVNGTHIGAHAQMSIGSTIGNYSVLSGATLGGTGHIGGVVNVAAGGFLAPGASIESLNVNSATIAGTLMIEIDESDAFVNDLLNVAGALNISAATLSVSVTGGLTQSAYVIATYGVGGLTGTFASAITPTGYQLDYNYQGNNQIALVAPEPASWSMAVLAVIGIACVRRRRK